MSGEGEPVIVGSDNDIDLLRLEIDELRAKLLHKESELLARTGDECAQYDPAANELSKDDIERFSRQLILPNFGVPAQLKLRKSSFLVVGMGGLGCPAAQYLVAAGCGRIGLVDYDRVERSNLHRQTLHNEERCGMPKVLSAREALREINPHCRVDVYCVLLNRDVALDMIEPYDVVLDCSDNVPTRYLLNDACVMLRKPLVSGSAIQLDGQLTVYNFGESSPCYRCLYPVPPPPEAVTKCGDGGVLGAVTGVIGSLQALEAIKVAVGLGTVLNGRLLLFDGIRSAFRHIKVRSRRSDCAVCAPTPIITQLINYEHFCNMYATDKDHALELLPVEERITVQEYRDMQSKPHLLIDVRPSTEYAICNLPAAVNVPMKEVLSDAYTERITKKLEEKELPIVVLCRRGNDSQVAVQHLRDRHPQHSIRDIIGGLHAWHYLIDNDFPIY